MPSIEEWLEGKTINGDALDPVKVAAYRRNRGIATIEMPAVRIRSPRVGPVRQRWVPPTGGVGTELKKILSWFGQYASAGCNCVKHAELMDNRGIDWCEQNIDTIGSWLITEARERSVLGWLVFDVVARQFVLQAIRNAKRTMPTIDRSKLQSHIIYHVMPLAGDAEPIWRKHIDWIRSVRNDYNGRLIFGVVTKHIDDKFSYCDPDAVKEAAAGLDAEFVIAENDGTRTRQGEGVTFLTMMRMLETSDPNTVITYGHCKGVTRWEPKHGPAPHLWAEAAFDVTFRNKTDVLAALDDVPICGPFRMHGGFRAGLPGLGTHWFFSGTFFAMRAHVAFSRRWNKLRKHYGNVEQWPRFLFSMETETRCLFFDSVTNLYDAGYWERDVTPAFEKWKAEHGHV